jgi:hypothetical protein
MAFSTVRDTEGVLAGRFGGTEARTAGDACA